MSVIFLEIFRRLDLILLFVTEYPSPVVCAIQISESTGAAATASTIWINALLQDVPELEPVAAAST